MDTSHGDRPQPPTGPGQSEQAQAQPSGHPQMLPPGPAPPGRPHPLLPAAPDSPAAPDAPAPRDDTAGPSLTGQAFAPPSDQPWVRLSPRFTLHRRISVLVGAVPVAAVGGFLISRVAGGVGALLWVLAVVISCGLGWIAAELAYRSWG